MSPTRGIAAGSLALLLAACAQPQALTVTPELRVSGSGLGAGRPVRVSVADKRASAELGGATMYEPGDFTVRDLAAVVREALSTGLERHGFNVAGNAPRELRVEFLQLDYGVRERSGLSRHVEGLARLKAGCVMEEKTELERTHRGELHKPVFLTAHDERTNNQYLSAMVSDAINALLADRELIGCLAR
jgi:uncharacterized lipoprotein YajG